MFPVGGDRTLYFILSLILVVIDQTVKFQIRAHLEPGEQAPFLPGLMELTYVKNTGAAFSSFSNLTQVLTLISLAASIVVAVLMARRFFKTRLGMFALSLILAGAVGNLIDRACFGFVTDMFAVTFVRFAVFNVADICVVAGGILFVICVLFFEEGAQANHDPG